MGKLFCLMGKSASGKDTIYQKLLEDSSLSLSIVVPYTTRPKRDGETEGKEYHFCSLQQLSQLEKKEKVIELREYHTIQGVWKYFTADDGQVDLTQRDYLVIGTLDSFLKMKQYFGKEKLVPIYIKVEDGLRLERALARERSQTDPQYAEMCRRFLADDADFGKERLIEAGVTFGFANTDLETSVKEIKSFIIKEKEK